MKRKKSWRTGYASSNAKPMGPKSGPNMPVSKAQKRGSWRLARPPRGPRSQKTKRKRALGVEVRAVAVVEVTVQTMAASLTAMEEVPVVPVEIRVSSITTPTTITIIRWNNLNFECIRKWIHPTSLFCFFFWSFGEIIWVGTCPWLHRPIRIPMSLDSACPLTSSSNATYSNINVLEQHVLGLHQPQQPIRIQMFLDLIKHWNETIVVGLSMNVFIRTLEASLCDQKCSRLALWPHHHWDVFHPGCAVLPWPHCLARTISVLPQMWLMDGIGKVGVIQDLLA